MRIKGRRQSVNVEKAMTFGRPGRKEDGYMATSRDKIDKLDSLAQEEMAKIGQSPRTKQQKENLVHNYLNTIHKAGRTPTPSKRGTQPKPPSGERTDGPKYPRTGKTSNATTDRMKAAIEKRAKNSQPPSFSSRRSDPVGDIIKSDTAKRIRGKQARLRKK